MQRSLCRRSLSAGQDLWPVLHRLWECESEQRAVLLQFLRRENAENLPYVGSLKGIYFTKTHFYMI